MMQLDKTDTAVIKAAVDRLGETQDIFCADHCEVCPLHTENNGTCIISRIIHILDMIIGNYGMEEEEE